VADKGKGKNIVIGDSRTSNGSRGVVAQKTPDKKTLRRLRTRRRIRPEALGGKSDWAADQTLSVLRIADGPTFVSGQSGANAKSPANSAG
jgi:serine/threonine protein phosphatase PrpC